MPLSLLAVPFAHQQHAVVIVGDGTPRCELQCPAEMPARGGPLPPVVQEVGQEDVRVGVVWQLSHGALGRGAGGVEVAAFRQATRQRQRALSVARVQLGRRAQTALRLGGMSGGEGPAQGSERGGIMDALQLLAQRARQPGALYERITRRGLPARRGGGAGGLPPLAVAAAPAQIAAVAFQLPRRLGPLAQRHLHAERSRGRQNARALGMQVALREWYEAAWELERDGSYLRRGNGDSEWLEAASTSTATGGQTAPGDPFVERAWLAGAPRPELERIHEAAALAALGKNLT